MRPSSLALPVDNVNLLPLWHLACLFGVVAPSAMLSAVLLALCLCLLLFFPSAGYSWSGMLAGAWPLTVLYSCVCLFWSTNTHGVACLRELGHLQFYIRVCACSDQRTFPRLLGCQQFCVCFCHLCAAASANSLAAAMSMSVLSGCTLALANER